MWFYNIPIIGCMLKMGSDIVNKTINIDYLSECCFSLLKNNSDAM